MPAERALSTNSGAVCWDAGTMPPFEAEGVTGLGGVGVQPDASRTALPHTRVAVTRWNGANGVSFFIIRDGFSRHILKNGKSDVGLCRGRLHRQQGFGAFEQRRNSGVVRRRLFGTAQKQ